MVHSSFNCFLRLRLLFVSIYVNICNTVFSSHFKYLLRIIFRMNIYIPLLSISRIRGYRFPLIVELSDLFPRFWWKNKILHFFQGFVTHLFKVCLLAARGGDQEKFVCTSSWNGRNNLQFLTRMQNLWKIFVFNLKCDINDAPSVSELMKLSFFISRLLFLSWHSGISWPLYFVLFYFLCPPWCVLQYCITFLTF